jgi:Flp pilus assembly protein TadG
VFIESGLVLVALIFMIVGAFDFGQFLFIHQALVDRGRAAARWGSVSDPTNTTAIQNMVLYNQTTAPSPGAAGIFGLTSDMVTVSTADSGTSDYRLIVAITNFPYTMISPIIGGTYTGPNITISVPLGLTG